MPTLRWVRFATDTAGAGPAGGGLAGSDLNGSSSDVICASASPKGAVAVPISHLSTRGPRWTGRPAAHSYQRRLTARSPRDRRALTAVARGGRGDVAGGDRRAE